MRNTQTPRVSVIVPCYNYGRFLPQMAESLRAQTCSDWECLIVDDGSTDESPTVIAALAAEDSRFRALSQKNAGPSAARNTGLSAARGDYIQFLDADDLLQRRKLELQTGFLDSHAETGLVYSDVGYFTDADAEAGVMTLIAKEFPIGKINLDAEPLLALMDHNFFVINAPLFRRSLLSDGLMPFDPKLAAVEDWDFWFRLARAGHHFRAVGGPDSFALVRYHTTSYSQNRRRMLEATLRLREKITQSLEGTPLADLSRIKVFEEQAALGKYEVLEGRLGYGIRLLIRAALKGRNPKWAVFALVLPFLRFPGLKKTLPLLMRLKNQRS